MKRKHLAFAIIFATAAAAAAGSCDEGRSHIFEVPPLWLSPVALDSSVAIVSTNFEKAFLISYDLDKDEPVVTTERVGHDPTLAEASLGGSKLFVICHGAREGEVRREDAEEESLHVIDVESGDHDLYVLGNPFTGLAESAGGRWLIVYFRSEVPGNNPNLMALVDLEAEPSDANPFIRGVRSDGVLRSLVRRGLVEAIGRAETVGRPILFGTTFEFLQQFGLKELRDLPARDELSGGLQQRESAQAEEKAEQA